MKSLITALLALALTASLGGAALATPPDPTSPDVDPPTEYIVPQPQQPLPWTDDDGATKPSVPRGNFDELPRNIGPDGPRENSPVQIEQTVGEYRDEYPGQDGRPSDEKPGPVGVGGKPVLDGEPTGQIDQLGDDGTKDLFVGLQLVLARDAAAISRGSVIVKSQVNQYCQLHQLDCAAIPAAALAVASYASYLRYAPLLLAL